MPDTTPTTDRVRSAAQRALQSLDDLIADTTDPGVEALGARHELATALFNTSPVPARQVLGTTDQQPTHSCGNCEGMDPGTCFHNPHRPPEQCPVAEFEDYGQQCQKPVGHELHTFEVQPAADQPDTTDQQPETAPTERRARYAAAIREADGWVLDDGQHMLDAVMAVADTERENDRLTLENNGRYIKRLDTEYDGLRAELEAHRVTLSDALGLGTGAPWDAIRDRAAELHTATAPTNRAAADQPADRRARYAAAITGALPLTNRAIAAVMAVADTEQAELRAQIGNLRTMYNVADARTSDLIDERDVLRAEVERLRTDRATFEALAAEWEKRGRYGDSSITDRARELQAVLATEAHPALRRLTPNEHDRAWHAIEGSAGEDGADPGTVLNAVLHALRIDPPTAEEEQAASPSSRMADEAQQPETEAHPTDTVWIAQELEDDDWVNLASGTNRDYAEGRINSYRARFPDRLTTRLLRATTTYTVEPTPAPTEEQPR